MKFAIIETGGKQYKVAVGDKIKVEKLDASEGENFIFDKILLIADKKIETSKEVEVDNISENLTNKRESETEVKIGNPYLKGAKVEAKILKQGRGKKKIVFRYHSKTRYRKKKGHRQHYTEVKIEKIDN